VRHFGIMTTKKQKSLTKDIPQLIKQNKNCIRTLFQILRALLQLEDQDTEIGCAMCGSMDITRMNIAGQPQWRKEKTEKPINQINIKNKSPDQEIKTYHPSITAFIPSIATYNYAQSDKKQTLIK